MQIKGKLYKKIIIYAVVFIIPIVCLLIHMYIRNCYPFGDNTILVGDAGSQYIAFFKELYDMLHQYGLSFFSFHSGMGYDFYCNYWYYLASPFTFIAMLFGKSYMELGAIFVMMLQIGGCAVTACYYFRHSKINRLSHGKINDCLTMLFGISYAMCDYFLAYEFNIMWLISLMLLPLVLLGVERLVDRGDFRLYVVTLFLSFVTNFYFAWYICIFAVIWFFDQKKENILQGLKKLGVFVLHSVVAAMCAAVVLLPCYLQTFSQGNDWVTLSDYDIATFGAPGNFIQGFFWGHVVDNMGVSMFENHYYCGVYAFVLIILYVCLKSDSRKQKIKRILEIVFLSICLNWILGIYVLQGFHIPRGYLNRFAFILILIILITAFETICDIEKIKKLNVFITAAGCALMIILFLVCSTEVESIGCYMVSILIMAYLIICLFLYSGKSIKKSSLIMNICIIGFVEIISNQFWSNIDGYDLYEERLIESALWSDEYEAIEVSEGQRKTAEFSDYLCFQYSDTDIFASVISSDMLQLYKKFGCNYSSNGTLYTYRNTTPITAALFNVRYVLTNQPWYYGGYGSVREYDGYLLLENKEDTALGYILDEKLLEWQCEGNNPMEIQNSFVRQVFGEQDAFALVDLSDAAYSCMGCQVFDSGNGYMKYMNTCISDEYCPYIYVGYEAAYDMDLYIYISDEAQVMYAVYLDGNEYISNTASNPQNILHIGNVASGQTVEIYIQNYTNVGDVSTTYFGFYALDEDVISNCYSRLDNQYGVSSIEHSCISGSVFSDTDGVLYTSIPYYKGFTAYVDGEETEIVKIADALIGISVPAGEHEIVFRYIPYGFKLGCLLSLCGIMVEIIFWNKRRIKEKA